MTQPHVMKTPRSVEVEITSHCNLRCRYCYYFDNPDVEYRDLPTAQWLTFFDECGECAVLDVTLQGGEPFIRTDLKALLNGIVHNRMRFSILSNGALINDENAAFLADTGRCDHVQVSVDGSCPATHDAFRGKGAFEGAIRGIKTLQRHQVRVESRVTIHRRNVHDLDATVRLLLDELGLAEIGTNSAGYQGACRRSASDVMLTTSDRQLAMETLLRLSEEYPGRIRAMAGPLAEARQWWEMEQARARGDTQLPRGGRLTGCGCHMTKIAVRADGVMVPCVMLPHMELGQINEKPLASVWHNSPHLNKLRQRHTIALEDFEFCKGCPYVPYCTGNCPGLAYTMHHDVDHPSPDACLRRFLADGGKLFPPAELAEAP